MASRKRTVVLSSWSFVLRPSLVLKSLVRPPDVQDQGPWTDQEPSTTNQGQSAARIGKLPLAFEANVNPVFAVGGVVERSEGRGPEVGLHIRREERVERVRHAK